MSRIYFHSTDDEFEVYGPERHHAGWLCNQIALAVMNLGYDRYSSGPPAILKLMPDDCYLKRADSWLGGDFARSFETWFRVSTDGSSHLMVGGEQANNFAVALNTALVVGSDPIKLLARLHGQCEIHAYVEGPNRSWLAGIIEQGRKVGILRADMGWEQVAEFLKREDETPIVTSYSVTDGFPNPHLADWPKVYEPDSEHYFYDESWYDLPRREQWDRAMEGLRENHWLEMKPDNWNDYHFENGITAFDVVSEVYKQAK